MLSIEPVLSALRSVAIALLLVGTCSTVAQATPAIDAYKQGNVLLEKKDYKGAIIALDKAIQLDPKLADAHISRARAYYRLGEDGKAIDDLNLVLKIDPVNATEFRGRGAAYDALAKIAWTKTDYSSARTYGQQAIENLSKAIALDGNQADAYRQRAQARWWLMNHPVPETGKDSFFSITGDPLVCDDYSAAIKLNPTDVDAYIGRAEATIRDWEQQIRDFNKAISLDPKHAKAYEARGKAYLNRQHYREAIDDLTQAIELNPEDEWDYHMRGIAYGRLQQYQKEIDDYSRAIGLHPQDSLWPLWTYYAARGSAYGKLGQYRKEIDDRSKVINLVPNNGAFYYVRGEAYEKLGKKDLAAKDKEMAAKLGYKPEQK